MNEYGRTTQPGTMGMTKVKNALKKLDPTLEFTLSNARVNGELMGCTGFVTDPASGNIVYLSTDHNHGTSKNNAYYRTAKHLRDFTGGLNHFASYAELPQAVLDLLKKQ